MAVLGKAGLYIAVVLSCVFEWMPRTLRKAAWHIGEVDACFAAFPALQFQEAPRQIKGLQQHCSLTISLDFKILVSYILLRF